MHRSLTRKVNRYFILLWAAGAIVLLVMFFKDALLTVVVGLAFGVLTGALQLRALRKGSAAFARTVTAWDVRRELISMAEGKWALTLQWLGAAAIGFIAFLFSRSYFLATFAAGDFALMFVREVITYPALRAIESHVLQSAG